MTRPPATPAAPHTQTAPETPTPAHPQMHPSSSEKVHREPQTGFLAGATARLSLFLLRLVEIAIAIAIAIDVTAILRHDLSSRRPEEEQGVACRHTKEAHGREDLFAF